MVLTKHNSYLKEAVDLDTYPISKLIRPWCAERAKRGPGKPVLIMHIVFFRCFHAISLKHSRLVSLKLLVSLISRPVQTRPSTVTIAAHVRRGLTSIKVQELTQHRPLHDPVIYIYMKWSLKSDLVFG